MSTTVYLNPLPASEAIVTMERDTETLALYGYSVFNDIDTIELSTD